MKIKIRFKIVLYLTLFLLYLTGLLVWTTKTFFVVDTGFGPEPPGTTIWYLRLHSIISLWFLIIFGYLYRSHIQPGLKSSRKKLSGVSLLILISIVIATVPGIFYITNEPLKNQVSWIHTYLGLSLVGFFFLHLFAKMLPLKIYNTSKYKRESL